jgi:hypothetical protein
MFVVKNEMSALPMLIVTIAKLPKSLTSVEMCDVSTSWKDIPVSRGGVVVVSLFMFLSYFLVVVCVG